MTSRLPTWTLLVIAALGVGVVAGLTFANLRFTQAAQDANAFLPRWEGAHAWLTLGRSPYDPQVGLSAQTRLYGRPANRAQGEDPALFAHPFPAMLFYAPFGLLEYPVARAAWMTLLELGLAFSAVLGTRLAGWRAPAAIGALALAFSLSWSPGFRTIVAGSAAPLSLLLAQTALLAARSRRDIACGALLTLTLVDPLPGALLGLLVCAWALSTRRWRILAGVLATAVGLVGISLLLLPGWPIDWLRQLAGWVGLGPNVAPAPDWPVLRAGVLPEILIAFLLLGAAWSSWQAWRGGIRELVWSAAFTFVMADGIGLLIFGRATLVYLLPAVLLIFGVLAHRAGGAGPWLAAVALVAIALGSWAPFVQAGSGWASDVAAGSVALLLAAIGLIWVRWWVTRGAAILDLGHEMGLHE